MRKNSFVRKREAMIKEILRAPKPSLVKKSEIPEMPKPKKIDISGGSTKLFEALQHYLKTGKIEDDKKNNKNNF
jgi:hypothetical protein